MNLKSGRFKIKIIQPPGNEFFLRLDHDLHRDDNGTRGDDNIIPDK
jgi:hypothetical protein